MPVSIVPNRLILTAWRAILNTWASAINSNATNIATNTANIATNAAGIASNVTAIGLRQLANSNSTLNYKYRTRSASDVLTSGDVNGIIHITNTTTCTFTFALGVLPSFNVGQVFIVANDATSTSVIEVSGTGGASLNGEEGIEVGKSGLFVKATTNTVLRLF